MASPFIRKIRRLNLSWHRDLGYFFSTLIIIYCISGIALNHLNEWDPDFVIYKTSIQLPDTYTKNTINDGVISDFGKAVHEEKFKVYDFPTNNRVKIYYDNASLLVNLQTGSGQYEKITKRNFFYESNVLHRNSLKGWKWVSDIFALMLIIISITGIFILKGKYGVRRRGIWIIAAGFLLPVIAIFLFYLIN